MLAFPWSVQAAGGIRINIISVKKNDSVTIEAVNFPANQNFKVRIGPYYTFAKNNQQVATISSGKGGTFQFTVKLSDNLKENDLVAIRLDSSLHYVYNAFYNNTINAPSVQPTATPAPTSVPAITGACEVVSVSPVNYTRMGARADFDALWEVKNTSGKTWESNSVDYKYLGGDKFYKRGSIYDLPTSVKSGDTIKIRVDMLAPTASGYYTTRWGLVSSSATLCNLYLTISVK